MSSDESDDEPLSNLAEAKKQNPEKFVVPIGGEDEKDDEPKKRNRKSLSPKKLKLDINFEPRSKSSVLPPAIERPLDVWLYLKDLNPTGPYSCLLCSEWFINRAKLIIHYVLNHKKDFCGICRYFVPDRDAWWEHVKFHTPWPCSQCIENFPTEALLRHHLKNVHKLVHCRLCHFRVADGDSYNTHLYQKHNVTNVSSKDEELIWELEFDGTHKFLCLLCSKSNNLAHTFFNHYMGFHHFTLKCFSSIVSGRDPPFLVSGADLSAEFVNDELKNHAHVGYVELEQKPCDISVDKITSDINPVVKLEPIDVKLEPMSDGDEKNDEENNKNTSNFDLIKNYDGVDDFDVTLVEIIVLQQCYYEHVNRILNYVKSNTIPEDSDIDYENMKDDNKVIDCSLCKIEYNSTQTFATHMVKVHFLKFVSIYSCRVCATTFDNKNELDTHISEELGDFNDLWLCQFCDMEFNNRESTRRHLTEHWDMVELDNCFSPHLGFKCKYCPTLFWNESDRETHEVRVHFAKYKGQYYKCEKCFQVYSDKIWFVHHYLENHQKPENEMPTYLLKCCICCLVLPNVEVMRKHFECEHPEARKIFCALDNCHYKPLSHRKSFKLHLRTIHGPTPRANRSVVCKVCGREFLTSRACGAHMAQVHGPGKFKCKLCREVLHTVDERKLHYLIRHPGQHPFECADCGKSFQYKSSLYMHRQEHAPNKQSFTCDYCGKVFMKKDSFREHVQIHEGPRHACSYCPMRFVQRSNMLRHERRHTGERPYACSQCPRTFADKGACTSHARTHSKDTSYACLYCGQTFVQKSKLTYHIRKHTGENLETCTVCSKIFTSACSLREHMKIHAKKDAVQCPLCDKKYQDERYMLRHLRTSHSRSHFMCPLCRKSVTSAAGLRHHVVTHSPLKTYRCKCCPKTYNTKKSIIRHLRKRHGLKNTDINIKDFFHKLDPRECQLNLDEEVMTSIFGPPKKKADILMGGFMTFPKNVIPNQSRDDDDDDVDEQSNESDDKDSESDNDFTQVKVKEEPQNDYHELEPTDFVSIKIEPMGSPENDYAGT